MERATDFTLLRCAEVALINNFYFFKIINENRSFLNTTYITPITATTNTSHFNHYSTSTTTVSGGENINVSMPSASNTIACFKLKPKKFFTYNSIVIEKNIRDKYGL